MEALVNHLWKVPSLPVPCAPVECPLQKIHLMLVTYDNFMN